MKANRKSSDRLGHQLRHQGHVRRRIDSAGEKDAERNVRHHAFLDRGPQQLQNIFLMLLLGPNNWISRRQRVPVLCDGRCPTTIDDQHVAGGKFLDVTKESLRRRSSYESEIVIERLFVYFGCHRRVFEDGFDLGSKDKPSILLIEVERLDARTISGQYELFALGIPKRDRIVAFDVMNEIEPAFFIKMQDSF